jgi:hypothetical protein
MVALHPLGNFRSIPQLFRSLQRSMTLGEVLAEARLFRREGSRPWEECLAMLNYY